MMRTLLTKHGGQLGEKKLVTERNPKFEKLVRSLLRQLFHFFMQGAHVGTVAVADTVTPGTQSDKIADILFVGLDAAFFLANVTKSLYQLGTAFASISTDLDDLKESFIGKGPPGVKAAVDKIMIKLSAGLTRAASRAILNKFMAAVKDVYDSTIEWIAPFFASLVQLVIPNDWGAAKIIIENFLLLAFAFAKDKPFTVLSKLFEYMPEKAQQLLMDPNKMLTLLVAVCDFLKTLFPTKGASKKTRVKAFFKRTATAELLVAPLILVGPLPAIVGVTTAAVVGGGGMSFLVASDYVNKQIDEQLVPRLDKIVQTAQTCLAVGYAFTYVIELQAAQQNATEADE